MKTFKIFPRRRQDVTAAGLPVTPPRAVRSGLIRGALPVVVPGLLLAWGALGFGQGRAVDPGAAGMIPRGSLQDTRELPPSALRDAVEELPETARNRALGWLRTLDLPAADVHSMQVDPHGGICYGCHFHHHEAGEQESGGLPAVEPEIGQAAVPVSPFPSSLHFHSRPGAPNVLYINFAGENVSGTAWNTSLGRTVIPALPYSKDTDRANFSDSEQLDIRRVWQRMAEDFAPFNIDVTTERPATFTTRTAMVVITSNLDANGDPNPSSGAGGVAYVNVFGASNFATYRPAWVYHNNLGNNEANIAEAASHEIGHNLGLTHDGTSTSGYYGGHGSGDISWGPLMGTGYGRNVSQWCKGDYLDANNTQDDLAQIAAKISYVTDDHSNTATGATALVVTGGTQIVSTTWENDPAGSNPDNKGVIERNTDVDVFSLVTGSGPVRLAVNPWITPSGTRGGNLDVLLELYNEAGELVTASSPATLTTALIETSLAAGRYYLHVRNAAAGNPLASSPTGYTSYGSIGKYHISGFVAEATGVVVPPSAELAVGPITTAGQSTKTFTVTYTDDAGVDVSTIGTGDIRVTGPNGYDRVATLVAVSSSTDGTPRTATYSVGPPAGSTWTAQHNGLYTVSLQTGEVGDIEGAFAVPARLGEFQVSIPIVYYSADMNANPGWTLEPQWQFGVPSYGGGGPSAGFTGTNIIGYNLGGSYANNLSAKYATTPPIAITGATSLTLRFQRWLRTRNQDTVAIQVSADGGAWTEVWSTNRQVTDNGWQLVQYALPASVISRDSVRIRWSMASNQSQNEIGWNIDDVQLLGDGSLDTAAPEPLLAVSRLTADGSPSHACSVTFTDDTAVRLASLGSTDLLVTGPNGYSRLAELNGADLPADGSPLTAAYAIPAPSGGFWSASHNGTYTIALVDAEVEDVFNNVTTAAVLGSFEVDISVAPPGVLTVSPTSPWLPTGVTGGSFDPASRSFTLGNSGGSVLNWTAGTAAPWLALDQAGGTLAPGQSVTVTASLTSAASSLLPGEFVEQLIFSNTTSGNGGGTVEVRLKVDAPAGLDVVLPGRNDDGEIRIEVRGTPGTPFVLEASTTLSSWGPVATGQIGPDGTLVFDDPETVELPVRFYRVRNGP